MDRPGPSGGRLRSRWPVVVVLLLGIVASAAAAAATRNAALDEHEATFRASSERARVLIQGRIDGRTAVAEVLRDAMTVHWPVSRVEFHDLVTSADGQSPFADLQATSFNRRVSLGDRATFEAAVRADRTLDPAGYPDFTITPAETIQDDLVVVDYLEPIAGNEGAFGFDVGSNPERRAAIEAARDTGEQVATAPIDLVQRQDDRGILILGAVYDTPEELLSGPSRRRHFVGVVSTVVNVSDLLVTALGDNPTVEVEVFDQGLTIERQPPAFTDANLVFDSDPTGRFVGADGAVDGLSRRLDVNVGGRRWSLISRPAPGVGGVGFAPLLVLLLGVATSIAAAAALAVSASSAVRAEHTAERRSRDLRSVIASAPDATVVVDEHGIIVLASDRVRSLLGYEPADLVGKPVEVLVPTGVRSRHEQDRDGFLAAPATRMMGEGAELEALHADGSTIPVEISLSPLPAHSLGTVVAALRDVSAQRQALHDLARANEMKTTFLSTVSHELRTPLTAISGFANLLAEDRPGVDDTMRADFATRISANAQSLESMIEELIDYSRLDRRDVRLRPESVDLAEVTEAIVAQLGPTTESHAVRLDAEPTPAFVDLHGYTRILTNLLTNAVRYAPAGSPIAVAVRPVDGGMAAELIVDDGGPGVPESERERIFERFWRGGSALQTGAKGTGIGLAIVRELAELSGGSIDVADSPLGGARFRLRLPAAADGVTSAGTGAGDEHEDGAAPS